MNWRPHPVLLVLLTLCAAIVLLRAAPWPAPRAAAEPRIVTLEVGGMVCADCVHKVTRSLSAVRGVRKVAVDLVSQHAVVECAPGVEDTTLTAAVRRAGEGYVGLVVTR